jgi:hypothetical protein
MTPTGPIYCETGHPLWFMAEPVNTVTNGFIILAAFAALFHVRRARVGMPFDLAILIFLLFATGINSFYWHAFRTQLGLRLDALSGLLFLFVFAGFWFRALFGGVAGAAGSIGLVALAAGSVMLGRRLDLPMGLAFVPAFASIAAAGTLAVVTTAQRYGSGTARIGVFALASAVTAAICRSIDGAACGLIPTGTHFLWHMGLSLAAYLSIVLLTRLKTMRREALGTA